MKLKQDTKYSIMMVVVAGDGSGDYTSLQAAIDAYGHIYVATVRLFSPVNSY